VLCIHLLLLSKHQILMSAHMSSFFYSIRHSPRHQNVVSNLSVIHDILPVVRLLLEGIDLIPIHGLLRGGVNQ
jgi:hypothetical protein